MSQIETQIEALNIDEIDQIDGGLSSFTSWLTNAYNYVGSYFNGIGKEWGALSNPRNFRGAGSGLPGY